MKHKSFKHNKFILLVFFITYFSFFNCSNKNRHKAFIFPNGNNNFSNKDSIFNDNILRFGFSKSMYLFSMKKINEKYFIDGNGILLIYDKNYKFEYLVQGFTKSLSAGYSKFNNKYYIFTDNILYEFNPDSVNPFVKIMNLKHIVGIADIDGKLIFLENWNSISVYNLETGIMIASELINESNVAYKRIDTKKKLILGHKRYKKQKIIHYNEKLSDSTLIGNSIELKEETDFQFISDNGDFIFGDIEPTWELDIMAVINSETGETILKTKNTDDLVIGNYLIIRDENIKIYNCNNLTDSIQLNITHDDDTPTYVLTDKGNKFIIDNSELYKCNKYFEPIKKIGRLNKRDDILKYFNLSQEKILTFDWYDDKTYDESDLFLQNREKLPQLDYITTLGINKNKISYYHSDYDCENPLYKDRTKKSKYKISFNCKEDIIMLIDRKPLNKDSLYRCTIINKDSTILKQFKIDKHVFSTLWDRSKIVFSNDFKYIYFCANNTLLNTTNNNYFIPNKTQKTHIDSKKELLYVNDDNKIYIFNLKSFEKIDSIVFKKYISYVDYLNKKNLAIFRLYPKTILYDLDKKSIICSFMFLEDDKLKRKGIIIQDNNNNFYFKGTKPQKELLLKYNSHINFKPLGEFLQILYNKYQITIDSNLINYHD